MTTALRENYSLQGKVNNDIIFTFQEVMSMQKNQPSFDMGKFEALETQLKNFVDELQKTAPALLSTTNLLPENFASNNPVINDPNKNIQPVRSLTPMKIRHKFNVSNAPVNQSSSKALNTSGYNEDPVR